MSFYIAGTGSALPEKVVTNDDLGKIVETSDEWIRTRTGIRERRVLTNETLTALTAASARDALKDAKLNASDIDLVICATMRGDMLTPSQACLTAMELGIVAPCFDINAACSAMLYSFEIADSFISTGKAANVLVLACEAMSRQLDWADRSTCVLFGDGAAAVVLRKGKGLLSQSMVCEPARTIYNPSYDGASPFAAEENRKTGLVMDGKETYKFAVNVMGAQMEAALEKAGLTIDDIDYVLPHQANIRIIDAAAKRFGISGSDKILTNIASYGNMSATSIPVLLDENAKKGKFKKGDKLLFVAFGAGMTAASAILEWEK